MRPRRRWLDLLDIDRNLNDAQEVPAGQLKEYDGWRVTNDQDAEWVIETCAAELVEIDRYIASLEAKAQEIYEKLERAREERQRKIEWRDGHLLAYFETIDPQYKRRTKTQEQYRLPSGKIVKKYPSPEFKRTDDQLLAWIKANERLDLVEVSERPKWGELKKAVTVAGNKVVYTATGEVVDGVEVIERPPVIEFKEG